MKAVPAIYTRKEAKDFGYRSITDPIDPRTEEAILENMLRDQQGRDHCLIKEDGKVEVAVNSHYFAEIETRPS